MKDAAAEDENDAGQEEAEDEEVDDLENVFDAQGIKNVATDETRINTDNEEWVLICVYQCSIRGFLRGSASPR